MVEMIVGLYFLVTGMVTTYLLANENIFVKMLSILPIALAVYYVYLSSVTIMANQVAGKLRLGAYHSDLKPGFHLLWFFFEDYVEGPKEVIEIDVPAAPEDIYDGDTNAPNKDGSPGPGVVPEGKTPALRVTFLEKVVPEGEKTLKVHNRDEKGRETDEIIGEIQRDDSFLKRQTAKVELSYGFKIKDADKNGRTGFQKFYENVGSIENAERNIYDVVVGGAVSRLQRISLAEAMLLLVVIAKEVEAELKKFVDDEHWGVDVTFVRIKTFGFSHRFNKALSAAAASIEEAKETVTASVAKATKITKLGVAKADRERQLLFARAEGAEKMAAVARTPEGRFAISANTVTELGDKTVIIPGDSIFGGVLGALTVSKNMQTATPQTSSPEAEKAKDTKAPETKNNTDANPKRRSQKVTWKDRKK